MRVDGIMGKTPPDRDSRPENREKGPAEKAGRDNLEMSEDGKRQASHSDRKLADIRRNIKNGVYTRPSFVNSIAEKMIGRKALDGEGGKGEILQECCGEDTDIPDVRHDRVKDARRKVSLDKYSNSKVLRTIADRILEKLGIR